MESFRNYVITSALLLGLLSFYIPIRYSTPYPRTVGPQLDSNIRTIFIDLLNEKQPAVFMLGDSMSGSAIDVNLIGEQLDRKVELVSIPGTASAIWYLIIKNNIVLAEHRPNYLVIFFRDSLMTAPSYKVTGSYLAMVDEYAAPTDTLLIERAYTDPMTPLERFAESHLPIFGSRWDIRKSIDYHIRYPLSGILLGCDMTCTDQAMEIIFEQNSLDETFLSEAINAADDYLYTSQSLDFSGQIEKSFLPEIIRLCKENDIQLVLVRLPTLRFEDPETRPTELADYIQQLGTYLMENNVPFLDFQRGNMPAEYFTDPLHLNNHGKLVFTRELTEALKAIVK